MFSKRNLNYRPRCLKQSTQSLFVRNKAKGRISKQVFQENKARQIFRKTNTSYPLIRTRICQGKKCSFFRKIWRALFSWNTRFEIRPFALLPTYYWPNYTITSCYSANNSFSIVWLFELHFIFKRVIVTHSAQICYV